MFFFLIYKMVYPSRSIAIEVNLPCFADDNIPEDDNRRSIGRRQDQPKMGC